MWSHLPSFWSWNSFPISNGSNRKWLLFKYNSLSSTMSPISAGNPRSLLNITVIEHIAYMDVHMIWWYRHWVRYTVIMVQQLLKPSLALLYCIKFFMQKHCTVFQIADWGSLWHITYIYEGIHAQNLSVLLPWKAQTNSVTFLFIAELRLAKAKFGRM